jgi:aerobic carbon-monoxide dehydrogenase medium subunit
MTMANIKLLQPTTLDEAVSLLSTDSDRAKIVGGGTALVIMLKNRLISPSSLVSLGRLPDLRYIRYNSGTGLRIGGLTSIRDAEQSRLLREKQPALVSALSTVGNVRVRNAATVAGNLSEADYASDPPCMLVALR